MNTQQQQSNKVDNTNLTAGGSSGGEGALVAFRRSILGIGTDIAGSIRIPSLCNGVYGFKPTIDRIPFGGLVSGAIEGLPGLVASAGPLAHSLEDLSFFMSTIIGAQPNRYDVNAHAAPWQKIGSDSDAPRKLTIGVLSEDEHFPLHPPVRRALDSAVKALIDAGHNIIHLPNSDDRKISYGSRLSFQYFVYGPNNDHISTGGEPVVASVAQGNHPMFTGPFPVPQELEAFEKINRLHQARIGYQDAWRNAWVLTQSYKLMILTME